MIFISYKSEQYDIARKIRLFLEANRYPCWMAPESIPAGNSYMHEIPIAIRSCDIFLLMISTESQQSQWVQKEIDRAVKFGKHIIPFHVDNSELTDAIDFVLSNNQRIEAYGRYDDACSELLHSLKEYHPPLPAEPTVSPVESEPAAASAMPVAPVANASSTGTPAAGQEDLLRQLLASLPPDYVAQILAGKQASPCGEATPAPQPAPVVTETQAATAIPPAIEAPTESASMPVRPKEEEPLKILVAPKTEAPTPDCTQAPQQPVISQAKYNAAYPGCNPRSFKIKDGVLTEYKKARNQGPELVIPYGVEMIDANVFAEQKGIRHIVFPPTLETIEADAFYGCPDLESVEFYGGVWNIGNRAFCACPSLKQVNLPACLQKIGDYAFADCPSAKISVRDRVSIIGIAAFNGCNRVSIDLRNQYYTVHSNCVIRNSDCSIVSAFQNCSMPPLQNLCRIGDYAFEGCDSIIRLDIPNGVTHIGVGAFSSCSRLEEVCLPASIEVIGKMAFKKCSNLQTVQMQDGVTTIDAQAFADCTRLKNITIPKTVTSRAKDAFVDCPYIKLK